MVSYSYDGEVAWLSVLMLLSLLLLRWWEISLFFAAAVAVAAVVLLLLPILWQSPLTRLTIAMTMTTTDRRLPN